GAPAAAPPPSAWQLARLWLRRNFAAAGWTAAIGMGCGLLISLVLWCSDILPQLHRLAFAYDQLPGVKRPWLLPEWQPPAWAIYALFVVEVGAVGASGLLIAALARTRNRAADLAAGLWAGLLMGLACFLSGGVWSSLMGAVVSRTDEDRRLLLQAAGNAGEHPGGPPGERLLEKYPDLRLLPPPERVRVLSAKIEAETILAIGEGLTFITGRGPGLAPPFPPGATAAAGSPLRGP